MQQPSPRSRRHEYLLFIEQAIENYKDSVPRAELLSIGDEAVSNISQAQHVALTELLLWEEVDRIIARRLRLPSYAAWRRIHALSAEHISALVDAHGRPIGQGSDRTSLIRVASEISDELLRQLRSSPHVVYQLSPRRFEELVAELLRREGAETELTPPTRDGGKDVIAKIRTPAGSFVIYVECKRYSPDHKVGVSLVRELLGVVHSDRVTAGMLVTTSSLSAAAIDLQRSEPHRLTLRGYKELSAWLGKVR